MTIEKYSITAKGEEIISADGWRELVDRRWSSDEFGTFRTFRLDVGDGAYLMSHATEGYDVSLDMRSSASHVMAFLDAGKDGGPRLSLRRDPADGERRIFPESFDRAVYDSLCRRFPIGE